MPIQNPKLTIIIPCFNERSFLESVINRIQDCAVTNREIILVDDCSTDGTRELIRDTLSARVDKVIYHDRNQGKGAAIRSATGHITGDMVIIQDADLEYDPAEYPKLMGPILDGRADVVFGSRFTGEGPHRVHMFWHYLGNQLLTLLSNMFTNLNLTDMETGYKIFRADIFRQIRIEQDRFGVEPELTAKIAKRHCRIYEVGISYFGRSYAEGKKITWKDGAQAIYCILKYNLFG